MPFFNEHNEAERYARNRPFFHPLAIAKAREVAGIKEMLPLALDAACGTGQSAVALGSIAQRVIGFDISWNMLNHAEHNERTFYLQARAEALPFRSGSAPLLSTALAFHWFDRLRFLRESWRVLAPAGWLLIYNNGFTGIMRENEAFQDWSRGAYQERFPTPPRDNKPLSSEEANEAGFAYLAVDSYENDVVFTPPGLAAYLTTQTNVKAALDQQRDSLESANQWLLAQIDPFFNASSATFVFRTRAWYLQKGASAAYIDC